MLTVFLSAVVSFAVAGIALSVILREFAGRWTQVTSALSFDERAFGADDAVRVPAVARRLSARPQVVQPAPRHAAAA